jgi:glyoxylase-like metal-dependent hydrolase (beta-lactamase superfamily II)
VPRIIRYPDGITAIDCEMAGYTSLVAAFVIPGPNPAVVETGPASVVATLIAGLAELGIGPGDVATFVGSHIHLDHAGGAGDVAKAFPNATIAVHEQGARHMIDPAKLMASSYRVFGPALDTLFGPLKPVPPDQLRSVDEGDTIDIGNGRHLRVFYAPGHARHHMAVQDSETGALFVGDSMGVYLPEADVLRPATPPPDFDLAVALRTLDRYRDLAPPTMYLSHFGPAPAGRDLLADARRKLLSFGHIVREAMEHSTELEYLAEQLQSKTRDEYATVYARPELNAKFEALNAFSSAAAGYLRYFTQNPDAEIPST